MTPEKAGRSRNGIHFERVFAHSPEQVWKALTDPQALSQWLLPTTFKPKRGHRFHFTRVSGKGVRVKTRCQVVELEAPRRLAYTWQAEDEPTPTLVTWTLEAVAEGTCLRLEHIGLETSRAHPIGNNSFVSINSINFANRLAAFLSSGNLQAGQRRMGRIALQASARRQGDESPRYAAFRRTVLRTRSFSNYESASEGRLAVGHRDRGF